MCLRCLFYLMICVIAMTGCNSINKGKSAEGFEQEYELKHKQYFELYVQRPQLQVTDSFLILVSHRQSDGICQLYSIDDGMKKVCTYGRIGNGPQEFLQPVLTYADGNEFGLNDLNLGTLAVMRINHGADSVSIDEIKRMKVSNRLSIDGFRPKNTHFVSLGHEHYVSCVYVGNNHFFTLSDSLLQPLLYFGESPIKEELSQRAIRNRLNGKTATHDMNFFYATNDLPYLASYRLQGESIKKNWAFFYKKPYYGVSNGDLKFSKENSMGPLLDMKADSNYIYLLYLDQLLSEYDYMNTEKSCSDKILVFNHKGEKVACLNLDCRLNEIAIDSKRAKIYGIAENPEISLVEFNLPEELHVN